MIATEPKPVSSPCPPRARAQIAPSGWWNDRSRRLAASDQLPTGPRGWLAGHSITMQNDENKNVDLYIPRKW